MQTTDNGSGLVARQVSLLKSFAKVSDALEGVAAFLWLPGQHQRFDGPRRIVGTRPLAVSVEVGPQGTLTFGVSKSRPVHGRMRYECIMRKDFTMPMTKEGRGASLCVGNDVMARRALNLLAALVRFGEKRAFQPKSVKLATPRHPVFLVPFHVGDEQIDQDKLTALASQLRGGLDSIDSQRLRLLKDMVMHMPHDLPGKSLVDARIVPDSCIAHAVTQEEGYEDFGPVLGVPHANPVRGLREMPNPALAILAKHNVTDFDALNHDNVAELLADFRTVVPLGERLADDEIFDALCNPEAPLVCSRGVEGIEFRRVVAAMRNVAGNSRAAWEATEEDLLEAAFNPSAPLILSRLSVTQVVAASDLQVLPAPYAGNFLPELDWQPPKRRAAVAA